jgi:hypothetical protein
MSKFTILVKHPPGIQTQFSNCDIEYTISFSTIDKFETDEAQILKAFQDAVESWVTSTIEGKERYLVAGRYIDIEQLLRSLDKPSLHKCLAKHGILDFKIAEPPMTFDCWNSQTNLTPHDLDVEDTGEWSDD